MTYASIQEAWGGVSGSNQLATPLTNRMHPIHLKQLNNVENNMGNNIEDKQPSWKTNKDLYHCNYGTHDCNKIFKQNQNFNNQKKNIAQGTQPFLPGSPHPQNYTFLPQYPWYPWAKQGYLMYPPQLSNMWYNNAWMYNPQVAQQITNAQMTGNVGPMIPTGPYQPQGFFPIPYTHSMDPPRIPKRPLIQHKKRESFTDTANTVKNGLIYFIFFLVALAVILCIFMICITNNRRS